MWYNQRTTSRLQQSKAFQNSSYLAGRLKKFGIKIRMLFADGAYAVLLGEEVESGVVSWAGMSLTWPPSIRSKIGWGISWLTPEGIEQTGGEVRNAITYVGLQHCHETSGRTTARGGFRHVQHVRPNRGPHKKGHKRTKKFLIFCNMLTSQKYWNND